MTAPTESDPSAANPHALSLPLPQQLTHENVGVALQSSLDRIQSVATSATPRHTALQVDASALERFDSSALALLLALRRKAHALQWQFAVICLPQGLQALAHVYGVGSLLDTENGTPPPAAA